MANFFIHDITLYHLSEPVEKQQYKCYFRHATGIADMAKGVIVDSSGTITIPTKDALNIAEGDIVVEGLLDAEYDLRALMTTHKCYKVLKVHDNRKGKLQHYKLEVKD